jgi:CDP-glucose 4,6-dehydratase
MINQGFWRNKKVLITGHTGFKGSWLCIWLHLLGADVTGYALQPPTRPSLFATCELDTIVNHNVGDVRDAATLGKVMSESRPEIIFHMAAQPLVRDSYRIPAETYETNVMGTVNLLEAVRQADTVKAVVNITTDKCYENREWLWGYRENDPLGGYDPYSSSKACSELVTAAYRNSFFNPAQYLVHGVAVATARAGNVIGGGDWANDRLIPDCIKALSSNETILVRSPKAIRPWQHVLEPLGGYLLLAQKLYEDGAPFAEGWNFGPNDEDAKPVEWIVHKICELWGGGATYTVADGSLLHEARYLKLDCSKAKTRLNWHSRWDLAKALQKIMEWTEAYRQRANMGDFCRQQIQEFMDSKQEQI